MSGSIAHLPPRARSTQDAHRTVYTIGPPLPARAEPTPEPVAAAEPEPEPEPERPPSRDNKAAAKGKKK